MRYCMPAAEIADRLGATKAANIVMLGALLELTQTSPKTDAYTLLKSKVKNARLFEVDRQAIDAGSECWRKQKSAQAAHLADSELTHRN